MNQTNRQTFCICIFVLFIFNVTAQIPGTKIGVFTSFSDIGFPAIPGKVTNHHVSQDYNITASGKNIWFDTDSFSFLSKEMNGDFIIQTRINFIGEGHDPHRKTGIMIRSSNAANASMVACTVHGDGLLALQYRKEDGANVEEIKFEKNGADVIQLEKKGNTYTMSVADFGSPYDTEKIENLNLGENLISGLFVCSHNDEFTEEVEFTNTRIFNTAPDDLVQYKEYLGSLLEVLDVETGERNVLASSESSWQAPNWTPDGKTLIYNASGKLYNFDLASKTSTELFTDFAIKNNNDHVLTFDGTQIGISHHAKEANGQSLIYTLPISGGIPKKVTEKSPSYLHGWSPDNKYLIYTAERKGLYNIFKISVDGGKEKQLTNTQGLDDGSEYSPDGKYIYFNSARTGTMQLWRMNADGKNPTQLTFDDYNDWFPHVSPDNKWLVFISFPKVVPAADHPFYEQVYIRLMPIQGGEPKTIGYVYGGQGTMNVPSWSPDGKKIAFISNGYFIEK